MDHTFLCENEGAKLKFLEEAFPSARHIFTDMRDLHKGRARDYKDGNSYKTVPQVRHTWNQNSQLNSFPS